VRAWREAGPGALALSLEGASAELAVARDGSVRLRLAAGDALPPDPAPALDRGPWRAAPAVPHERDSDEGRHPPADAGDRSLDATAEGPHGAAGAEGPPRALELAFEGPEGAVHVAVELRPFAVWVRDRRGAVLARIDDLAIDAAGGARACLAAAPGERFLGFGEKSGPLDKRGRVLRMRNRDPNARLESDPLYVSIPFFLRLDAAGRTTGCLLDVPAPSRFDVAATDPDRLVMETRARGLDLLLFPGPAPADVLRRYTAWSGRAPRPPRWALGHHQSRWSYASEAQVRRVARELRRRRIPTDAIHLDIDYMRGFRVFTFHPRRFPDPKGLAAEMAQQGLRLVSIVDPGVKADPDYEVFRRGRERRAFCIQEDGEVYTLRVWPKESALPDFNRPEVRSWWAEEHRPLLDAGIAGIWNDMNEPAGWQADLRLGRLILPWRPQDTSRVRQADPADPERDVPHEHVRNLYGLQMCRATAAALRAARPEARPFVLTRSGYAGIQRHAAVWTGDDTSTWGALRRSLPMLMGLSVSGVPFCGADIGGFAFSCTPELYARWIQIGALSPFARTHSMWLGRRQEPWRFGRRVEAVARAALELRMRLLPYLYALFAEAEASGAPVWRPLVWEFPGDPGCAGVDDQVMVGPALLAAPVVHKGAEERELYLPPGTWLAWDDDARYVGPRRLRVAAPLERLPLFARAGAVVATQSPTLHTGERPAEPLVLHVFPGGDGATTVIEDDGESTAYTRGEEARTPVRLRGRAGGRLRLELGPREGSWDPGRRELAVVVRGAPPPVGVWLDGAPLPSGDGAPGWRHAEGRLRVRLPDDGAPRALEIEPAP